MMKNKMMRIASVLLIAVLLSTCAISGTFAKYVTDQTGSDTARVAKFGVTIVAEGATFADTYETDDEDVVGTIANSVVTAGGEGDSVVAPGTAGEMVAMTLTGTPEVAVSVTYAATLELEGWELDDGTEYCPIVFTVNGQTYGTNDTDATNKSANIAALITAVQDAIADYSANYAANTNLSVENSEDPNATEVATPDVSWEWAFSTSEANDEKDTVLGDAAAEGNAATINLTITTTVTQID